MVGAEKLHARRYAVDSVSPCVNAYRMTSQKTLGGTMQCALRASRVDSVTMRMHPLPYQQHSGKIIRPDEHVKSTSPL